MVLVAGLLALLSALVGGTRWLLGKIEGHGK